MIKVDLCYSTEFKNRYIQEVAVGRLIPDCVELLSLVPDEYASRMNALFDEQAINELVLLAPELLVDKIRGVYDTVPVLAERYCLEYYLKDLYLDECEIDIKVNTAISKEKIRAVKDRVVSDLDSLLAGRGSLLLYDLIDVLRTTELEGKVKKLLYKIWRMKDGISSVTKEQKKMFPKWVNELEVVFNYNRMATKFGNEMTSALQIRFCPYCNQENIETITDPGAKARPDLDHFHPKSKFPFLALSLSNLIPAGSRCNQTYKKSKLMFDKVNPFVNGVGDESVFSFNFSFDSGRCKEKLVVGVNSLRNDIDNNLSFFKIINVYNQSTSKDWFVEFHERYEFRRSLDCEEFKVSLDDPNRIRMDLFIDIAKSPKESDSQKFKIDALRQLSGKNYPLAR